MLSTHLDLVRSACPRYEVLEMRPRNGVCTLYGAVPASCKQAALCQRASSEVGSLKEAGKTWLMLLLLLR